MRNLCCLAVALTGCGLVDDVNTSEFALPAQEFVLSGALVRDQLGAEKGDSAPSQASLAVHVFNEIRPAEDWGSLLDADQVSDVRLEKLEYAVDHNDLEIADLAFYVGTMSATKPENGTVLAELSDLAAAGDAGALQPTLDGTILLEALLQDPATPFHVLLEARVAVGEDQPLPADADQFVVHFTVTVSASSTN